MSGICAVHGILYYVKLYIYICVCDSWDPLHMECVFHGVRFVGVWPHSV